VGTSAWTEQAHLAGLLNHPQAEVVAICGRNAERAHVLAARHGIAGVFTDYRQMIADAGLDALIVATPDDLHFPITMAALDAGLHVLCEKPLAPAAGEARAMYERAQAAGAVHLTMFTYRWLPPYRYLRRLIDSGYLGRLTGCEMEWLSDYGSRTEYNWRFDAARGNGVLGDLGSHFFDLACWYLGPIAAVRAEISTARERLGPSGAPIAPANDDATVALEFASGARGSLRLSAVTYLAEGGFRQRVRIQGEEGALEVELSLVKAEVRGRHGGQPSHVLPIPDEFWQGGEPFDALRTQPAGARLLVDAIRSGSRPRPSFYEGWMAQEAVDAALLSTQTGVAVALTHG
jgi:predicted dehydrogenase